MMPNEKSSPYPQDIKTSGDECERFNKKGSFQGALN